MVELDAARERFGRWYRGTASRLTPDKLVLQHVQASERLVEVASFSIAESGECEGIADDLMTAIENDAEGLGGVQRYLVIARRENKRVARLPLRVLGSSEEEGFDEGIDSEPPTATGLTAQLMRHLEVKERMNARSWGQVITTMQRTIARLQDNVEANEDRRLAATRVAEEVLSRKHERDVLTRMAEDNADSKKMMLDKLSTLMPFLMHWIGNAVSKAKARGNENVDVNVHMNRNMPGTPTTGPEAGPPAAASPSQSSAEVAELLSAFFSSLQEDQATTLYNMLTPEQLALIQRLAMAQQAAAAEAAGRGPAPEAGAPKQGEDAPAT